MVPNFLYIGTSKAGSTWLLNTLAIHPDVYLAPSKGLYFFDQNYDKGSDWYLEHFARAAGHRAIGEISHSYLSSPNAPERIAALNPAMRLLVCLREPVDRAFSDYLDLVKNRQYDGPFDSAVERYPRLVDRGRYATHLRRYLDVFDIGQLHVRFFDDLQEDPQRYANDVYRFLGVIERALPPSATKRRMPAGEARSATAATFAKKVSRMAVRVGLKRMRSTIKRSTVVRNALYRPYTAENRPQLDPAMSDRLRERFASEVFELEKILDLPVRERWGY